MSEDRPNPVDQIVWLLAVIGGMALFVLVASWLVEHGLVI